MKCPVDGTELRMAERKSVEIDYCPQCRGVWLDRGELDKIIERSAAYEYRSKQPVHYDDDDGRYYNPHGKPKRKTFLDEVFDIFD